jgi:branched-chain amino acid transport system ATP-binding protein
VALEVEGVSVSYGKFVAVESVTLSVRAGECVAVIGPNGHGKSSMVTAVAGLVRRGGVVRVFGQVLPAGSPGAAVRAGLVLVPERRHLYPELTTRDNIMLGSYSRTRRISARQAWEDVSGVLDMFPELTRLLDQKAGTLSGGQQQMVALARAMAARPRVLRLRLARRDDQDRHDHPARRGEPGARPAGRRPRGAHVQGPGGTAGGRGMSDRGAQRE